MSTPKFLQIHTLTSYPATLLNRDDAGFAKRIPFGGTSRTRVSSQCLKYHWRNFKGDHSFYEEIDEKSYRSRETFARKLAKPLMDDGYPKQLVVAATLAIKEYVLSGKKVSENELNKILLNEDAESEENLNKQLKTGQLTVFGEPEMRYLRETVKEKLDLIKEEAPTFWSGETPDKNEIKIALTTLTDFSDNDIKKNLKGLKLAAGLDAAMFGRMVTSDFLSRGDAAIHVAHAITTHAEESESDYFSAVDELRRDEPEESGELGAGHINSTELASGLFYNYIVVDIPLLISNIEGVSREDWEKADKTLALDVLKRLVHIVATVSPGAKLGSTAPYSWAQCILVETGSAQPRTLANAFQNAVKPGSDGLLANSYRALSTFIQDMDGMYGNQFERRIAATGPKELLTNISGVEGTVSIDEMCNWITEQFKEQ